MTIKELTAMLRAMKTDFTLSYEKAMKERDKKLEEARVNFKPNAPLFRPRVDEIKAEFERVITELRINEAKVAMEYINDVRQKEIDRAKKIDISTLEKISALKGIPLTKSELLAVKEKYAASDYYGGRMLAVMAEENGVEVSEIGIESPLDVKLGILSALERQVDIVLQNWNPDGKADRNEHILAIAALGEDTLRTLEQRYSNDYTAGTEKSTADKAFYKIVVAGSQSEKAVLIANALGNAKGEVRNRLLYKLATEADNVSDYAFNLAGASEEVGEWKNGKAKEYSNAVAFVKDISAVRDVSIVKQRIAEQQENSFLNGMLVTEAKNNSVIREAISGEAE